MRRLIAAAALVLAASPALAAGTYLTRTVQDGTGAHFQSYYDESGIGLGPFDPVYALPPGFSTGGGGGGTTLSIPQGVTTTPTNPQVPAQTAKQLLPDNGNRKYLQWRNETGGDCHFTFGTTQPSATVGMLLGNREPSTLEASDIEFHALNIWCAQAGAIDIIEGQ